MKSDKRFGGRITDRNQPSCLNFSLYPEVVIFLFMLTRAPVLGACLPSWNQLVNTHSNGATQNMLASSVDDCKSACISNRSCLAIDVDRNFVPVRCWMHTNPSNVAQTSPAAGVDQYRLLEGCDQDSTDSFCSAQWSNMTNTNSYGATQYSQYTMIDSCLNFCISLPSCVAVDINNSSGNGVIQCWVHNSPSSIASKNTYVGINQYVLISRCSERSTTATSCSSQWNNLTNSNSYGATQYSQYTTIDSCLNFCISFPTCVAVDINNSSSNGFIQCWVHNSSNNIANKNTYVGINQYVLINRCGFSTTGPTVLDTPCSAQWNNLTNTNSYGATQISQYTTVDGCLNFCISLPTCVAVDINNSSGNGVIQCWVHNSSSNIANKNTFIGINQYVLVSGCFSRSTTATSCSSQWNNLTNTNSYGATQYSQYTTIDSCLNFCISFPSCVAVDINNSSGNGFIQCWVHNSSSNIANKNTYVGINQYVLISRCGFSTTATTTLASFWRDCTPSWLTRPMTHSLGGTLYSNCSSDQTCLQCCLTIPACIGVDVDSFYTPSKCFIYTDSRLLETKLSSTTVTQFQLISRCSSLIACNVPGYRYCQNRLQCLPQSSFCNGILDCNDNSDELGCSSVCAADKFSCGHPNNIICLLNMLWCNGVIDCPDATDEPANCKQGCSVSAFHCGNGTTCIQPDQVCDGNRSCPDGSDESSCPNICPSDKFSCINGVCTNITLWCNNRRDCSDNSDELSNCTNSCPDNFVRCKNMTAIAGAGCVTAGKWCDGFRQDCIDGSDEAPGCMCQGTSHKCPHGCIPDSMVCDGLLQCSDGSDETNCSCSSGYFKCRSGACISNGQVCDGQNNCGDYSDEITCGVCNQLEFSCVGLCLNTSKVCDGSVDCPNAADELNCDSKCDAGQFLCDGGRCLANDLLCNNIFNCLDLSDEINCSNICEESRGVACSNGLCLLPYQWCDFHVDCPDFSDEMNCSCVSPSIKCMDGLCIQANQRCNGVYDCSHGEDEYNCSCTGSQFRCPHASCISRTVVCDGVNDCPDGSDEIGCNVMACSAVQFQCASDYHCIGLQRQCDGIIDCADASDEQLCLSLRVLTAESSLEPSLVDPRSPAVLVVKFSGSLSYRVCYDSWSVAWSDVSCQQMGYDRSNVTASETNVKSYLTVILIGHVVGSSLLSSLVVGSCPSNKYVLLNCFIKTCGRRMVLENLFDTYIENGAASGTGSLPWHVAIYKDFNFFCSGSLISERWILTSAQCLVASNSLQPVDTSRFSIRLGSVYRSSYDPSLQVRFPDRVVIHPNFNRFTFEADVGLLRLSKPISFTDTVSAICLPDKTINISYFEVCLTAGWSHILYRKGSMANALTQVRTSVLPLVQCRQLLQQAGNTFILHDSILCASSPVFPSSNSCLNDLGRPWICKDKLDQWTQVGVVINDTLCGDVILATKLSSFSDWIKGFL